MKNLRKVNFVDSICAGWVSNWISKSCCFQAQTRVDRELNSLRENYRTKPKERSHRNRSRNRRDAEDRKETSRYREPKGKRRDTENRKGNVEPKVERETSNRKETSRERVLERLGELWSKCPEQVWVLENLGDLEGLVIRRTGVEECISRSRTWVIEDLMDRRWFWKDKVNVDVGSRRTMKDRLRFLNLLGDDDDLTPDVGVRKVST